MTFAADQINNRPPTQPFEVFFILAIVYYVIFWRLTRAKKPETGAPRLPDGRTMSDRNHDRGRER